MPNRPVDDAVSYPCPCFSSIFLSFNFIVWFGDFFKFSYQLECFFRYVQSIWCLQNMFCFLHQLLYNIPLESIRVYREGIHFKVVKSVSPRDFILVGWSGGQRLQRDSASWKPRRNVVTRRLKPCPRNASAWIRIPQLLREKGEGGNDIVPYSLDVQIVLFQCPPTIRESFYLRLYMVITQYKISNSFKLSDFPLWPNLVEMLFCNLIVTQM